MLCSVVRNGNSNGTGDVISIVTGRKLDEVEVKQARDIPNHPSIMAVMTSMVGWAAWSAFTRYIQLGLCHKTFSSPGAWRGTAIFITVGAGFGYWMDGVEERQRETVQRLRNKLVESRELRAQRQAATEAKARAIISELEEKTRQAAK